MIGGAKSANFGRPQKDPVQYGGRRKVPGKEPPKRKACTCVVLRGVTVFWGTPPCRACRWFGSDRGRCAALCHPGVAVRQCFAASPPFLVRFRVSPLRFSVLVGWLRRILRCWWCPGAATRLRRNMLSVSTGDFSASAILHGTLLEGFPAF